MQDKRPILLILLILYFVFSWSNVIPPSTPITKAIVIYESTIGQGPDFNIKEVLLGKTSQELRSKDKWRQYDKDAVPEEYTSIKDETIKNQKNDKYLIPWIFIFHDSKVTWKGQLPINDRLLNDLIQQQGGM